MIQILKKNGYILFVFILFYSVKTISNNQTNSRLYRAVDLAQINVDINLINQKLTVDFMIPDYYISLISKSNINDLMRLLTKNSKFIKPDINGKCTKEREQIHIDNNKVIGYQSFICTQSKKIKTIDITLFDLLPSLKKINAWIITQSWQNKQIINKRNPFITINPGYAQ